MVAEILLHERRSSVKVIDGTEINPKFLQIGAEFVFISLKILFHFLYHIGNRHCVNNQGWVAKDSLVLSFLD